MHMCEGEFQVLLVLVCSRRTSAGGFCATTVFELVCIRRYYDSQVGIKVSPKRSHRAEQPIWVVFVCLRMCTACASFVCLQEICFKWGLTFLREDRPALKWQIVYWSAASTPIAGSNESLLIMWKQSDCTQRPRGLCTVCEIPIWNIFYSTQKKAAVSQQGRACVVS